MPKTSTKHHLKESGNKKFLITAALTLVGVAVLQLALAGTYLVAFHAPMPHELQIAVVGDQSKVQTLADTITSKSNSQYKAVVIASDSDAVDKLKTQSVFAIYTPAFTKSTITIASANSKSLSQAIAASLTTFDSQYQLQARQALAAANPSAADMPSSSPTVKDIAPLPSGDSNGLALFYTAFSAVFGGYLAAVALNLVRGKRAFWRYNVYLRTVAFGIFSIVTSLLIGLISTHGVGAIPVSDYWATVGILALVTFGVSMFATALISLLGILGTALVIILFVVIGTPASGGTVPLNLTGDGIWQWLAPFLPTGAGVGALRQAIYFGGENIMQHLLVPIAYSVLGFIALIAISSPRSSIGAYTKEIVEEYDDKASNLAVK